MEQELSRSNRFDETGRLEDLTFTELQLLVSKMDVERPRGVMVTQERYKAEVAFYASLGDLKLAIMAEYMRVNMARHDTIVYEGAMKEFCLPALIERVMTLWMIRTNRINPKEVTTFIRKTITQLEREELPSW